MVHPNNATSRVYLYPTPRVGAFPNYSPRKPDKGQSGYQPRASCKDCQHSAVLIWSAPRSMLQQKITQQPLLTRLLVLCVPWQKVKTRPFFSKSNCQWIICCGKTHSSTQTEFESSCGHNIMWSPRTLPDRNVCLCLPLLHFLDAPLASNE